MSVLELVSAPMKKVSELFLLPSDGLSVTGRNPYTGINPVYDPFIERVAPVLALRVDPINNGSALEGIPQGTRRGYPRDPRRGYPSDPLGLPLGNNLRPINLLISNILNNLIIEREVK